MIGDSLLDGPLDPAAVNDLDLGVSRLDRAVVIYDPAVVCQDIRARGAEKPQVLDGVLRRRANT